MKTEKTIFATQEQIEKMLSEEKFGAKIVVGYELVIENDPFENKDIDMSRVTFLTSETESVEKILNRSLS